MKHNKTIVDQEADQSDLMLANAAKNGDETAFELLISRYQNSMRHFIYPYCSIQQDIDDICQEALKKAYLSIDQFKEEYAFSTWLFSIAKNAAIDHYRKNNNQWGITINEPDDELHEIPDIVGTPEESMIGSQTYDKLINAIDNLPPLYKEVAKLRFVNEYAYEEISAQLNLPINTIKTRLRRAKEILEKQHF